MPGRAAVDRVVVAEQVARGRVVRDSVHGLLGGAVGGGVLGHVEVNDTPAMVGEHDEDGENAEPSGGAPAKDNPQ